MKKFNKKGFTIVELVIVIAVIAILAAVMIPTFSGIVEKAKNSAALQEVTNAYKETLANDLSTADTADDEVYVENATAPIIVKRDGVYISISTKGEATVVETGTETHTYVDGLLEKIEQDTTENTDPEQDDDDTE